MKVYPVVVKRTGGGGGGGGAATVIVGPDFGTEADLAEAAAASMPSLSLAGSLSQGEAAQLSSLHLAGFLSAAEAASLSTVALAGSLSTTHDVVLAQHSVSAILAPKDSWCDVIAACPTDLNRNATDLQLEGIIVTRKDLIVGWDLAGFPTGATVVAATVTANVMAPPATSDTLTWNTISGANETWTEAAVKCSNIPAAVAAAAAATAVGTAAGPRDLAIALNATGLAAIAARMGVGSFSLRGVAGVLLTNAVFESADESVNDAAGPRLTFSFTVPV